MKPTASELHDLYWAQRLSTHAIADRYTVSHMSVKRWLRGYGIKRRAQGRGLANREMIGPSPDELHALVHVKHRNLRDIGAMFGVSAQSVVQWLDKHNIPRPTVWETRRKGVVPLLPTSDELHGLLEQGMTLEPIAKQYGVSRGTIVGLAKQYGLAYRVNGFNGGVRYACNDGHEVRSVYEQAVDNWLSAHGVEHAYEPALPFDRRYHADFLANGWYIEVWGVLNSPRYTTRRKRKQALYKAHEVPLIEVFVHTLDSRRPHLLVTSLHPCLTPASQPLDS